MPTRILHLATRTFGLFLLSLSLLLSLSWTAQASGPQVRPIEVTSISYQDLSRSIHTSALLAYKSTQKLSFKVGGPVADVLVDEGDEVEKGQVLAQLNTIEVRARVGIAEVRQKNAMLDMERLNKLYKKKVISQDQLQDAETALDIAEFQLRMARFNLRYSTITAPADGRVTQRTIEPGELIAPNQTAFMMADDSRGWVMRTGLSDRNVVRISDGDPATISFDAWPLVTFTGEVSQIAEAADPRSGLFGVEIALTPTNAETAEQAPETRRLRDGYIGRITIVPGKTERVVLVPSLAIVSVTNTVGIVFVLNDDHTVAARRVRLHYLEGSEVAVSGELEQGEQVVTTGAAFLHHDDKVKVVGQGEG